MAEDDDVGRNNASVGDKAWYRDDRMAAWELNRKVNRVGIINEHGYPLNIEVTYEDGSDPKIVSPMYSDTVMLFPVEIPEPLAKLTAKYPNLLVIRESCNCEVPRYQLLCKDCREVLQFLITMTEVATIVFRDGDEVLSTSKPEVDNTESEMSCACEGISYEIPLHTYEGYDYYEEE